MLSDAGKMMTKLERALSRAERCPFHECLPKMVGIDIPPPPPGVSSRERWDEMTMIEREAFLRERYPDVFLVASIGCTCFCEECAKTNPTPGKHNKFGYGFTSQYSWSAALGNWNKACLRFVKSAIMKHLKGNGEER